MPNGDQSNALNRFPTGESVAAAGAFSGTGAIDFCAAAAANRASVWDSESSGGFIALPKLFVTVLNASSVPRWISSPWIVVRSMFWFSDSHCSTARRSLMRLSSSSTFSVGVNGDARLDQARLRKSMLSIIWPKPLSAMLPASLPCEVFDIGVSRCNRLK